ncbi:unnamed protein product [Citrullus colocynthis]|uniref:Protein kinase domain-containing protein n=1 Tax=Citrullus colocynthis TaxID=252529 RepID=A0ABP0XVE9_9ROSI
METATLDYHMFIYSSDDRNISVWYDCPQEDINWENYRFPCCSKQGKQGRTSYVFETSGQIGGCKMKMEVAVMINGSEGGMNKTRPALVVGKGRRRWFSFGYKNLYVIQGLEGRKNVMALLGKAGRLEFTVPYMEQTNQDRKEGRKNLMNSLEKATRRRFNNIFQRLQAMEGLKEGGKNKVGLQEKARWFDFIYKKTRNYRRDEIEGLKLEGRKNRMSLLEKPANRTKQELEVEYKNLYTIACDACRETHGKCGENATYQFYCICETQDQHRPYICIASPRPVAIASGSIILTISIIIFIYSTRKHISDDKKIEEMIRRYSTHTPKRYSYSQLKKITNSFTNKLGQGGFSTVYKGKLRDGCDVAVKLLNESKENGEEFMNEVVSITKTSHVNIATLLGFCYERSTRALVYEYMSNGSLDKYIFQRGLQIKNGVELSLSTLYGIVIGVRRGLEYLHCHCNTKILHFDIKPDNILLDNNFCPKISDFGLAKQCMARESHVSMTGMKGTVGFMAPEVIFRNLGKVSHKSDVYSYGMLVLEMLGEKKCPNERVGQSSEGYFPDWIYNNLTRHEIDEGSNCWGNTKEEKQMARKMIIVGLHCIQTSPHHRPSMTHVVAMLEEGSIDSLQIPPKPNSYGPPATDLLQATASSSSSSSPEATRVATAPQGTPGYVDAKYYECCQLTNKSHVFSFGVVLLSFSTTGLLFLPIIATKLIVVAQANSISFAGFNDESLGSYNSCQSSVGCLCTLE